MPTYAYSIRCYDQIGEMCELDEYKQHKLSANEHLCTAVVDFSS